MELIRCPLCGNNKFEEQFKRKALVYCISNIYFRVVKCVKCSMVFVNPRPSEDDIHEYYTKEFYKVHLSQTEVLCEQLEQLALKWSYVKNILPGTMLDIGCQKGEFMYYLQTKGWDVNGFEFNSSPPNVFNLNINYVDLKSLSCVDGGYDLVTLWAVLEHAYQPLNMMKAVYDVLRPGGKVIALVTNYHSIPGYFMKHDDIPRHTNLFTKNTFRALFEKSKLKINKIVFNHRLFGGTSRGAINFCIKRAAGENIEDILSQNRSPERWSDFSSTIRGKYSRRMEQIDGFDQKVTPIIDKIADRLGFGFIMIGIAEKSLHDN